MNNLILGDCLEKMKDIPDKSVDLVLTDPPYGTTACKWDTIIPFGPMWEQLERITKDNGAICLFGSEPFSSSLRMSNIKLFKYDWIWKKQTAANFASVKTQPLRQHEIISIFCKKTNKFFPIKEDREGGGLARIKRRYLSNSPSSEITGMIAEKIGKQYDEKKFPSSVQFFANKLGGGNLHPTQKPVALLEYLIKTYTLENETVLDFTMGSGSTGVACKTLNRNFIGIEKDEKYFQIAKERIEKA